MVCPNGCTVEASCWTYVSGSFPDRLDCPDELGLRPGCSDWAPLGSSGATRLDNSLEYTGGPLGLFIFWILDQEVRHDQGFSVDRSREKRLRGLGISRLQRLRYDLELKGPCAGPSHA